MLSNASFAARPAASRRLTSCKTQFTQMERCQSMNKNNLDRLGNAESGGIGGVGRVVPEENMKKKNRNGE